MAINLSKFSEKGLNSLTKVDIDALSPKAAYKVTNHRVVLGASEAAPANFVINTTKKHSLGPIGFIGTLVTAHVSSSAVPAGGTLSWGLVAYDASANGEVILTDTANPESIVAREAQALVLATTNVELAADDTLELHCTADNSTVTTDAAQVCVTCQWLPTETTTLTE